MLDMSKIQEISKRMTLIVRDKDENVQLLSRLEMNINNIKKTKKDLEVAVEKLDEELQRVKEEGEKNE